MSKALDQCAHDLAELTKILEEFIETQTGLPAYPQPDILKPARKRKPAVKRTRTQLLEAATAAPVVLPAAPAEDVDTSWLDLLSPAPVAAPVAVVAPAPVAVPEPLYVDATELIRIELNPPHILDFPEPQPVPARRTLRQAFRDGYNSYGN